MMNDTKKKGPAKPPWLKKRIASGQAYHKVVKFLRECSLHTVCEAAHCPNMGECFSKGTATFMILGDHCTRDCRFCAVPHDVPGPPDKEEPQKVADAVAAKSGLMLGLGETHDEVVRVLQDLLAAGCKLLTLGQYLAPSKNHHPVVEYVSPDEFLEWEKTAYEMGFKGVASGPFVRSSFHAGEMFEKMKT